MSRILSLLLFVSITLSAKPNLLIHESSPYLKQHAHNPIQWYPWGDEAFEKAKKEDKPIFLSIGYSTCHWCHVMNEESFEDNATAAFLNNRFVCIKVDREERPDLDETYLLALSLMNAEKGWPLNLFLTPDAKPIFGSSYLSRERFNALSRKLSEIWGSNPQMLISDAEKTYAMMQQLSAMQLKAGKVDQNLIDQALHQIESRFDPVHGGFGTAPKFPNEPHLLFLLQHNSQSTTPMIKKTLETMASRALYDQLGGGFHRYAVDAAWREPHFEKMLYNQAQLSRIYSLAYARFNTPLFKQIAIETNDYVLRDMRGSNGLFYTAQDAGGKDAEGIYYLWSLEELKQLLSPSEYRLMHLLFDLREPNFGNTYSLNRLRSLESYAAQERIPLEKLQKQYRSLITKLHHARAKRPPIHRDEKIVTAYNAMMIDTLIETSQRFKRPDYLKAAKTAAETLWRVHRNAEGHLYRSSIDDRPFGEGVVDDYAHFSLACAHLYDVTRDEKWLKRAQSLADTMIERFYDTQNGGFFMNAPTALSPIRPKEISDRYTPSANGAAMIALKALIERNSDQRYRRVYTHTLAVFSSLIATDPSAYTSILSTLKDSAPLLSATDTPSLVRYGMNGAMRATLKRLSDSTASLDIELKKPWRINTHDMQDKTLYPTVIKLNSTGWKLIGVRYPKGKMKKYEGKVRFLIYLKNSDPKAPLRIEFSYQGCSDTTCLAPETLRF